MSALHVTTWRAHFTALGFVSLEVRVITAKEEALQTLRIPKNLARNTLSLYFKEIVKPVNRASETPVN